MTSHYKMDEKRLNSIISEHLEVIDKTKKIKLVVYYKTRKLKNLLIKNNPSKPILTEEHHVVYQYTCKEDRCSSIDSRYIGYTTTTLKSRMVQHKSIKSYLNKEHQRSIGYKKILNNIKVIFRSPFVTDLLIAEALLIKKHKPSINQQEEGSFRFFCLSF